MTGTRSYNLPLLTYALQYRYILNHTQKLEWHGIEESSFIFFVIGFHKRDDMCEALTLNEDGSKNCTLQFLKNTIAIFKQ